MNKTDQRFVVFLDFDGTVSTADGIISDNTVNAIKEARERGHYVFLNTGRSPSEIPEDVKSIGFDGYITAGGAFAQMGERLLHSDTIPPQQVEKILHTLEKLNLEYTLQYFHNLYATPGLMEILRTVFADASYPVDEEGLEPNLSVEDVAKVVFASYDKSAYDNVKEELGEDFSVITGTMPYMGTGSGEISIPRLNKAAPFPKILEELGVPVANTIAIGDAANDLEMLRAAGVGIAMGHASPSVVEAADEVTSADISEGIRDSFIRHGLIGK